MSAIGLLICLDLRRDDRSIDYEVGDLQIAFVLHRDVAGALHTEIGKRDEGEIAASPVDPRQEAEGEEFDNQRASSGQANANKAS